MTITNGYCELDDIKQTNRLNFNSSDSVSDDMLEGVIESVSRKFDDECHRMFYLTANQDRWYTPTNTSFVFIDDIPSDSDLTIAIDTNDDGTADIILDASSFILEPFNAVLDGWPYQKIVMRQNSTIQFPKGAYKSVKVSSPFGWAAVPKNISQACMLQCERLFKRFSTPLGSESMTALGRMTLSIPSLDPDVISMISVYIKKRSSFG